MILSLPGEKKDRNIIPLMGPVEAAQCGAFQELQLASSTICHHVFFPKLPDRVLQHSNLLDPSLLCDQFCSISCSSPGNWFFGAHSIFRTFMFWICYRHLTSQSFLHLVWNVPILFSTVLVSFQVLYSNYKTGRTRLFKTETLVFLLIPVAFRMLANLLKDTSIIGFLLLMSVVPYLHRLSDIGANSTFPFFDCQIDFTLAVWLQHFAILII